MSLSDNTRTSAIESCKRIRSKAIDTERLLLRDAITTNDLVNRAEEIAGQARVLALSAFQITETQRS
jgi:hypothetical protein